MNGSGNSTWKNSYCMAVWQIQMERGSFQSAETYTCFRPVRSVDWEYISCKCWLGICHHANSPEGMQTTHWSFNHFLFCPSNLKFLYKDLSKRCPSLTRYPTGQTRHTKEHVMKHWTSTAIRKIKRPMPLSTDRRNGLRFRWRCVSYEGRPNMSVLLYLFIQADFKPLPTYANLFQDTPKSVIVDRSIAQDLKDRCGAKMPLACFGFLVDRDGKRSLLQFRNMYRNYRTFISNHPILIFRTMQVRERHQNNNTVDGRNPAITAWDALNLENSGINYQPPLVNAGFLPLCHFPFSNQPDVFFPSKKSTTFWPKKVEEAAFTSDQLTLIRFALDQKAMMQLGHLAQGLRQMVDFSV